MMKHIHRHTISISHALDGIVWAYRTQPNYKVHVLLSTGVILAGIFFNVSALEWCILILTMSVGLVIETLNTAIESTTDAITHEWREEIKVAKDVAAAAMLTHAAGSIIIAGVIFIPKML